MAFTINWIAKGGFGVLSDDGTRSTFTLLFGQTLPEEFRVGETIEIEHFAEDSAQAEAGMEDSSYYEFRHGASGRVLRTYHKAEIPGL